VHVNDVGADAIEKVLRVRYHYQNPLVADTCSTNTDLYLLQFLNTKHTSLHFTVTAVDLQ